MSIEQDPRTMPSPVQPDASVQPDAAVQSDAAVRFGANTTPTMDNGIDRFKDEDPKPFADSPHKPIGFEAEAEAEYETETKSGFFGTLFSIADGVPYLGILLLGLLAFGYNAYKTNLWLLHGQGILDMLKATQVTTLTTGIDTNAFVLWPASIFLLQSTLLESSFSPATTYAWLAVILHILILGTSYLLARTTGSSSKQALAAVCIIIASPAYLSMYSLDVVALLLTICLLLSLTCFYRGWLKERATSWLISAFCFTALAGFSAGVYWMLLPCLVSLVFLAWRRTFTRVDTSDSVLAFALFLCIFAGIIGFYALQPMGRDYLARLLETMQTTWEWKWEWNALSTYIKMFALFALPWTLLLSINLLQKLRTFPKRFIQARTTAPGQAWLWWTLATSFFIIAFMPNLRLADTYIVWPIASILFANTLLNLTEKQSHLFFTLCSIFLTCCGVWLVYLALSPPSPTFFFKGTPLIVAPFFLQDSVIVAKLVLLGALLIFMAYALDAFINTNHPQGALLALTLATCVWMAAATYMTPDASISLPADSQTTMMPEPKPELPPEPMPEPMLEIGKPTPEMMPEAAPEPMPQATPEAIQEMTDEAAESIGESKGGPSSQIPAEAMPNATPEIHGETTPKALPAPMPKPTTKPELSPAPESNSVPKPTPEPDLSPESPADSAEPKNIFQI